LQGCWDPLALPQLLLYHLVRAEIDGLLLDLLLGLLLDLQLDLLLDLRCACACVCVCVCTGTSSSGSNCSPRSSFTPKEMRYAQFRPYFCIIGAETPAISCTRTELPLSSSALISTVAVKRPAVLASGWIPLQVCTESRL
jgi:hypothetical protein